MLSIVLNIAGSSIGLIGLLAFFGTLLPRWGGSSDESMTRFIAIQAILVGLGFYIASFFVG